MKKLKQLSKFLLIVLVFFASCTNDGYEIYKDKDYTFNQITEPAEIFIAVDKEKGIYHKVILFSDDYVLDNGVAPAIHLDKGFHLYDGEGFQGYDLDHKYSSLDDALDRAKNAGTLYTVNLGRGYQFQSGSLYSTNPFKKLSKK